MAVQSVMSSRAIAFQVGTVAHLPASDLATHEELAALAALGADGLTLGVVALPAAIEESFYRLNNLPPRLARLYQGLDPLDPDEDILEEAEPTAMRLLGESYLLDDLIDAVYSSLAALPDEVVVRRAGQEGEVVGSRRDALLAIKRAFRDDWTVTSVLDRLAVEGRLGVEARPVLVHPLDTNATPELVRAASTVLGHDVALHVASGSAAELTRVAAASS